MAAKYCNLTQFHAVVSSVSVPLHFYTDPDPWIRTLDHGSRSRPFWQRLPTKKSIHKAFCLFLIVCTFINISLQRNHITEKTQNSTKNLWFILIFCLLMEGYGSVRILEAQKHTDPTDPDPQP
jgi:hypothetical protein